MSLLKRMRGAVTHLKDAGSNAAIRGWLSGALEEFGSLVDFRLDSATRSAQIRVLLKGETDEITVWVEAYDLISEGEERFILVREIRASREWLTILLRRFLAGRRHLIPAQYARLAGLVLKG